MPLNAHEQAVRAAVDKTIAQGKIGAAQFRVDRSAKQLERVKDLLAKARSEFDAANIALEAAKSEFGMVKKAALAPVSVAQTPVSVPQAEADPLAPIESQEG